jgi:hypothetical protein
MTRGGKREGAGRKPGAVTQKTREVAEKALQGGITPLEVMLEAMNSARDAGDLKTAASFARDAAPYIHAKLSSVQAEITGADGGPLVTRIELVDLDDDGSGQAAE